MPISLANNVQRPKLEQTVAVPVTVTVANPTEADGSDSFTQYITTSIEPNNQTVTANADNSSTTLTISADDTSKVRVGDVVSAATGIQVGTVVTAVSGTSVTIDLATDAELIDEELTFNAPTTTANLMALYGVFSASGTAVSLRVRGYKADGTTTGGAGGTDATTYSDMGDPVFDQTIRLDLDAFLSAARVARVNS